MPIKGLTDQQQPMATNRLGKNWVGDKRQPNMAGKDLKDRFRLDLPAPYDAVIQGAYGSLQPKSLRVFFPYDKADQCFEAWNDAFTTQGLQHRCDGDRIVREVVTKTAYKGGKSYQKRCRQDCDKPCQKASDEVICKACVSTGYLTFIVRELFAVAGMSQVIAQTITGINNVVGITAQLRAFEAKYGSLKQSPVPSPATYGFIPFVLQRTPREISRPLYDGKSKSFTGGYTRGEAWPILITEDPAWLEHWQNIQRRMQIQQMIAAGQQHLLMGEDLAIAHEMTQISLPGMVAMPALQSAPMAQQVLPEYAPINTEAIADEDARAQAVAEPDDEADAYHASKVERDDKTRIAAVNQVLKLDRNVLSELWDSLETQDAGALIEAMIIRWAIEFRQLPLTMDAAGNCLDYLVENMPFLVDEDLATAYVAESERWAQQIPSVKPAETVDGINID